MKSIKEIIKDAIQETVQKNLPATAPNIQNTLVKMGYKFTDKEVVEVMIEEKNKGSQI
jgi:uncharacterized protein YneF (UPF0154 family)